MRPEDRLLLHKHTRREFRTRMDSGELRACIIPIAAIEQHLEHLAMEHDWRSANYIALRVAEKLSPHVVVAQGVMAGISEHHMKHVGTLTLTPATFLAVLGDLIDSVVRAGFENVLVLNGHGGNIVPCRAVWDQLLRKFQVNLQFLPYWDVLTEADANELQSKSIPGHAQEFETAFALAAFPENVRSEAVADQPDPAPAMATAENGQLLIDRTVDRVADYLQEMLDRKRTAEVPAFFE
ncbi:creatininase family protein [Fuerstiella marisgermanici]|uniref:Creatinine amidohydrolase n=1 Tax=Fuerstiella marisgermanici TaxID=1891926 RepID=A0A1P8WAY2_9PLAN|nr:creatininase family protein [Fuerstiella marisgermanici]APZ91205.1 Creatinine amidohydrolase [Fuerstiella marisgermanici]